MGSLYHLGQKLVDFANIITKHANRNDTVPSSSLVYKGAKNIATIEDSNVASQAYSVGNFLILDGQLYRVTNAIAQGGTITVGTNVTLDSVGSELKSLNDSLTKLAYVAPTSALNSSHNMNNVDYGTYYQGGSSMPLNAPSGANNAYIIVLKGRTVDRFQIWISANTKNIQMRMTTDWDTSTGTGTNWSAWTVI